MMNTKVFLIGLLFLSCSVVPKTFLVFGGKTGWIGQKIVALLKDEGHLAIAADSRLENRQDLAQEIAAIKPDCVINAAGVTGVPNVDWCESNKQQTIRANIIGALNVADVCFLNDTHMINLGTGCIYEYDLEHPMGGNSGFTEDDIPNFHGSFYSHSKGMLDDLLKNYPNVLNLRLRMPISSDFHPRNFIVKISKYQKVINIPNSMSILDDLLPLISQMAERRLIGTLNFVNPGVISHNEILDLYKEYVDPSFTYQNFSVEEQDQVLKAKRSNNYLDTSRLEKEFPQLPSIKKSMIQVMQNMKANRALDSNRSIKKK